MRDLLFRNEFKRFNNIGGESIYHMIFKLILNHVCVVKMLKFSHNLRNGVINVIT